MRVFKFSDKAFPWLFLVLFIYLFFVQLYVAFPFTIDDAYISLQYAKHLSQDMGFVWYQGELPLEGYSNFLYVLVAALLFKLHLPALLGLKCLSIAALGLTCFVLYHLSRCFLPKALAFLPSLMLLFYRGQIIWTVSGLEMPMYQLWVVLTVWAILKGEKEKRYGYFSLAGLAQALAGLTRPEGPALFLLFGGCIVATHWREVSLHKSKKKVGHYALSFSLIYLPYLIWRLIYFGRLFPNPIYCKAAAIGQFAYTDMVYLYLVIPLLLFMSPACYRGWDKRYYYLLLPNLLYLVLLSQSDFVVAFFNRLFLPVFVLLLPILVKGIQTLFDAASGRDSTRSVQIQTSMTSLLAAAFLIHPFSLGEYRHFVAYAGTVPSETRRALSNWIEKNVKSHERVAMGDCGLVPFLTTRRIIDTYCLNAREMTSPHISLSYDRYASWLMTQSKPEYVIIVTMTQHHRHYYQPLDTLLLKNSLFNQLYKKSKRFNVRADYYYDVYQRRRS